MNIEKLREARDEVALVVLDLNGVKGHTFEHMKDRLDSAVKMIDREIGIPE